MKTKILSVTILALALSSLHFASGQESFSFKLYMESLANGKKDTLELDVITTLPCALLYFILLTTPLPTSVPLP